MSKTSILDRIFFTVTLVLVSGTVALVLVCGFAVAQILDPNENWGDFLHRWQTLFAGILAFIGAVLTVRHLKKQIKLHEDDVLLTRRRKALASKSTLPDALSRLCGYTEDCINYITEDDQDAELPEAPQDAIDRFKTAIEFIDDHSGKAFYDLVVKYQYYRSRINNRSIEDQNFGARAYDTIHFRCLLNRLFEYCRDSEDTAPTDAISYSEMYTAYKNCLSPNQWDNPLFLDVLKNIKESFPLTEEEHRLIGNER